MAKVRVANPFKPTAGAEPPVLAGREKVIRDFSDGLAEGPGAPGRLMRISGPRGSGKTVLLTELGDIAQDEGWLVVDETARKGLVDAVVDRLAGSAPDASVCADIDLGFVKARAGVSTRECGTDLRSALAAAIARPGRKGVLVTVDEVQDADRDDMTQIAHAVQHMIREGRDVAFVFAGLTTGVADFVNGQAMTFLRRAKAEQLNAIPDDEVAHALKEPFAGTGMHLSDEALEAAVRAADGYAYLVQLVGYNVWRAARRHFAETPVVSMEDVADGVDMALANYDEAVIEPALAMLSERAMRYLVEMAKRDGDASTGDIAKSIGVPATSLSSARRTLIARQVIEPAGRRGYVRFSVPKMREYVSAHADDLLSRYDA